MNRTSDRYFHGHTVPPNHPSSRRQSMFHRVFTLPLRRLFLCCTPGNDEPYRPLPKPTDHGGRHHRHGAANRSSPRENETKPSKRLSGRKVAPYPEGMCVQSQARQPLVEFDQSTTIQSRARDEITYCARLSANKTISRTPQRNVEDVQVPDEEPKASSRSSKTCWEPERVGVCLLRQEPTTSSHESAKKPRKSKKGSKMRKSGTRGKKNQVRPLPSLPVTIATATDDNHPVGNPPLRADAGARETRTQKQRKMKATRDENTSKPVLVTVKPAPRQIKNSPQAPRKRRQYQNPANFTCRPLPPLPPPFAAQNARNINTSKPKTILQTGAGQLQPPRRSRRPAEPGRLSLIPLTTNSNRELKCTVYRPSDFEATTVNGAAVRLGQGTFGEVNLLRLLSSKRPLVAVKFYKSHLVQEADVWREVAAMQVVQDHWAFPQLHGIIRSQMNGHDLPAIVLEFIGNTNSLMGMTVADAVLSKKYMPFKHNWVWIANDIARGLAHLHSKDYLHCDLKTNNALLWRDPNRNMWRAKIIDFGKACLKNEAKGPMYLSKAEQRETSKSFPHVPHEVIAGEGGYSVEGDVFSLGYLLLQVAQVSTLKKQTRKLGERCSGTRPRSRPTLSRVIQDLTSLAVNGCY